MLSYTKSFLFYFFKGEVFFFFFLDTLGLWCCKWAFSSCIEQGATLPCRARTSLVMASLVAEYRLQELWHAGSAVTAHGLGCSIACRISLDQGLNPPELSGGFLYNAPPGKSYTKFLCLQSSKKWYLITIKIEITLIKYKIYSLLFVLVIIFCYFPPFLAKREDISSCLQYVQTSLPKYMQHV